MSFTIQKKSGQPDPDLTAIRDAVCGVVNTIGFVGELTAGQVHDTVFNHLLTGQTVRGIDLLGRLRYPDGSIYWLRDSDVILIPNDPSELVSSRTVQFFLEPEDVGITVTTVSLTPDI